MAPEGYTDAMKLALWARFTVSPKRLLADRWVHDTAHKVVSTVRKARDEAGRAPAKRPIRRH